MKQKFYNRHSLSVGSRVKITNIKSGTDINNVPYWKFYVPFSMPVNGHPVIYKHLWCRVAGKPIVQINDWVEIKSIITYQPNCRHDTNGGMTIFEDLFVEVEKVLKENSDDNDSI
jgi:hypothetical protein